MPVYYTHDDRYGPFNRVTFNIGGVSDTDDGTPTFVDGLETMSPATTPWHAPVVSVGGSRPQEHYLKEVLIPVPTTVRLGTYEALERLLSQFDYHWLKPLNETTRSGTGKPPRFLWRSLLVEAASFKASVRRRRYAPELIRWYSTLTLPPYVWLFEVSIIKDDESLKACFSPMKTREIHGEFLFDATSSHQDPRCLTTRMLGYARDYGSNPENEPMAVFDPELRHLSVGIESECVYTCFKH